MASLNYVCDKCKKRIVLYKGDPIGIPFARLPEAVAEALAHECKEPQ